MFIQAGTKTMGVSEKEGCVKSVSYKVKHGMQYEEKSVAYLEDEKIVPKTIKTVSFEVHGVV